VQWVAPLLGPTHSAEVLDSRRLTAAILARCQADRINTEQRFLVLHVRVTESTLGPQPMLKEGRNSATANAADWMVLSATPRLTTKAASPSLTLASLLCCLSRSLSVRGWYLIAFKYSGKQNPVLRLSSEHACKPREDGPGGAFYRTHFGGAPHSMAVVT
jgi:hypothetical protein